MPIKKLQKKIDETVKKRRLNALYKAGSKHRLAEITYTDKKGDVTRRTVEPYKMDGVDFWGYDPEKESIRRFKTERLMRVKPLRTTFQPRWDIEMTKVAMYKEEIYKSAGYTVGKLINKLTPKAMKAQKAYDIDMETLRLLREQNMTKEASGIPKIKEALRSRLEQNIATMMATSHEYKEPAVDEALALVKNYRWEKAKAKISDLQGIDKPTDLKKVRDIANAIKGKTVEPLITVDKLHGIKPQTKGKRILLDGHHRLKALEYLGQKDVPIYKGTFTGKSQLPKQELRQKN